mmetsp:Transcript_12005/g.18139  ORF Transcript_12005/g.18139 Transcript_12005/m.18139 type:complete len:100 (-) Transcript_12005:123-422(-)
MISLQSLGPKAGSLTISDKGVGMSDQQLERCRDAFFTTTVPREEPNYHYSREFGTVFSGAGFGLLKSKVYLSFHCADMDIKSKAGDGTEVHISFTALCK